MRTKYKQRAHHPPHTISSHAASFYPQYIRLRAHPGSLPHDHICEHSVRTAFHPHHSKRHRTGAPRRPAVHHMPDTDRSFPCFAVRAPGCTAPPLFAVAGVINDSTMCAWFSRGGPPRAPPGPGLEAYAASKGGAVHFVRSLAWLQRKCNVRVCAICPQFTQTPLVRDPRTWLNGGRSPVPSTCAPA